MKKVLVHLSIFAFLTMGGAVPIVARADDTSTKPFATCPDGQGNCSYLVNPANQTDPLVIVAIIIRSALMVMGSITLLMIIWGGFQWLTSAGNAEKVSTGSKTMVWAVIGTFLVLASYLILNTYIDFITSK